MECFGGRTVEILKGCESQRGWQEVDLLAVTAAALVGAMVVEVVATVVITSKK